MNISRNHPISLRHAPKKRGGLNLPHFYATQGITQIKLILWHLRMEATIGEYLLIHLQWTQHLTGLQTGILTDTCTNIEYIPPNWWMRVRDFLKYIQENLQMEDSYTIPPLQTEDYSIMEHLQQGRWTMKELQQINACRLYLQITYMLELMTNKKLCQRQYKSPPREQRTQKAGLNGHDSKTQTSPLGKYGGKP